MTRPEPKVSIVVANDRLLLIGTFPSRLPGRLVAASWHNSRLLKRCQGTWHGWLAAKRVDGYWWRGFQRPLGRAVWNRVLGVRAGVSGAGV